MSRKIHGPGAMYGGVTLVQGFGAEMSILKKQTKNNFSIRNRTTILDIRQQRASETTNTRGGTKCLRKQYEEDRECNDLKNAVKGHRIIISSYLAYFLAFFQYLPQRYKPHSVFELTYVKSRISLKRRIFYLSKIIDRQCQPFTKWGTKVNSENGN